MQKRLSQQEIKKFQSIVLGYFKKNGRILPWRDTKNPYHILVSEIMLQQTQVDRTIPKFKEFIGAFPTIQKLAKASTRNLLQAWQGMGYNRRALNLQKCAQGIVKQHGGQVPHVYEDLVALPGIGPYTAKAIMAFAFNKPVVLIETNVRTVYLHYFFPKLKKVHDDKLLPLISETVDTKNSRAWYSALMDYGSYLKKSIPNPSRRSVHHVKQTKFEGSIRQARGAILKELLKSTSATTRQLEKKTSIELARIQRAATALVAEGIVRHRGRSYSLVNDYVK